ncbi:hypothetical protein PIB30_099878 [Stylosanthes scabra]|uniref:Uncharacterized protein n=1 Tax=Stylosanthes scabra TaxID=79078 RepID=A0ABU6QY17_9FABA|nr:hypothetical protein [Stylosanthes scabra]
MPCVHGIAAILPSESYWSNTNYLKTDAPFIKRPIGRPKLHSRKRDPVEDLMQGDKLKRTFRITCSKCREKGHNYKTCKGAPANPNWKPKTSKKKEAPTSNVTAQVEVSVTPSAPQTQAEANPPNQVTSMRGKTPFRPPARNQGNATKSTNFRAKQPVRRKATRKSPPLSNPAPPSQVAPQSIQDGGGPSTETMAATKVKCLAVKVG